MLGAVVNTPGLLLLDRHLAGSAKLLWMILRLSGSHDYAPVTPGPLAARSRLDRDTVRRGLDRLASAGWLPDAAHECHTAMQGWASMPGDLLLDTRVGLQPKLLYGILQLTPGFRYPAGQFTHAELCCLAGVSPNTAKQAVKALQAKDWLPVSQRNKFCPVHFTLRNRAAERREAEAARARFRLEEARFLGEALMREYLTLIVNSDEYEDNATPGFLVNPYTGREMQFDRYYPPSVAFEFNGPQHYRATSRYSDEIDVRKQQGRNHMKMGISQTRGIRLVVVHAEDLTLEAMRQKARGLLPLRELDGHEPLIAYLESVSRAYRRSARRHRWPDDTSR